MDRRVRYDAFISYRHCEPDSEIATKIHKKLENYRLPKEVAEKVGRDRLRRVFRDEAELGVADNLSEEIDKALRASYFLICICSPEYLQSAWCRKELEAFLHYKDRKHVLLVLAKGEPDDAFPEVLQYEDVERDYFGGTKTIVKTRVEPLAADCRAETGKERDNKIDIAVTRLVAAIIGVGYDDLEQRQKKEILRRTKRRLLTGFLTASAIMLTVIGICVFFLVRISRQKAEISKQNKEISMQNEEIANQNAIIRKKYEDSMAAASDNLLRDGKRLDAVYAARLALPDDSSEEYSEDAAMALVNALGIYSFPSVKSGIGYNLPCSCSIVYAPSMSSSGRYLAVYGLDGKYYVMDLYSGDTVFSYECDGFQYVAFDGDNGVVFQRDGESIKYYDLNSGTETDLGYDGNESLICSDPDANAYAIETQDGVYFYKGTQRLASLVFSDKISDPGTRSANTICFVSGGNEAYVLHTEYDAAKSYCFKADLQNGSISNVDLAYDGALFAFSTDGQHMAYIGTKLYVQDVSSATSVKTKDYTSSAYNIAVHGNDVAVFYSDELEVRVYDCNWNEKTTIGVEFLSSSKIVSTEEGILLYEALGGVHVINDGNHTYIQPDDSSRGTSVSEVYKNGTLYVALAGDYYVSTYSFSVSDYVVPYDGEWEPVYFQSNDDPNLISFQDSVMKSETEYTRDEIANMVFCENANVGLIQLWNGTIYVYDRTTYECVKRIYNSDVDFATSFYYSRASECYFITSSMSAMLFNKDFIEFAKIKDCYFKGVEPVSENPILGDMLTGNEYLITPLTYEEIIKLADEALNGYEPDKRIKEKYSIE